MDIAIPEWLSTPTISTSEVVTDTQLVKSSEQRLAHTRLSETIFELVFEDTLDRLMLGHPLSDIVSDYNEKHTTTKISTSQFQRWMLKDKQRKQKWDEAMEMGSHLVMSEMIRIADGVDNPIEDVQRSTLRVKARQIALKAYNRKQFGDDSSAGSSIPNGAVTVNITGVVSPYQQVTTIDI